MLLILFVCFLLICHFKLIKEFLNHGCCWCAVISVFLQQQTTSTSTNIAVKNRIKVICSFFSFYSSKSMNGNRILKTDHASYCSYSILYFLPVCNDTTPQRERHNVLWIEYSCHGKLRHCRIMVSRWVQIRNMKKTNSSCILQFTMAHVSVMQPDILQGCYMA